MKLDRKQESIINAALSFCMKNAANRYPKMDRAALRSAANLGILAALKRFDPTKGTLFTFVRISIEYALRTEARKSKRAQERDAIIIKHLTDDTSDTQSYEMEEIGDLLDQINLLGFQDKCLLYKHFVLGESFRERAAYTHKSATSEHKRLHGVVAQLRRLLDIGDLNG